MTMFHYSAVDQQGRAVSGQVDAASAEEARQVLQQRGLQPHDVERLKEKGHFRPLRMNSGDAMEFAQTVAQVSSANLALAMGLNAAADETGNRRVSAALKWLAARVQEGQTLEVALEGADRIVPRPMRGLIMAASSTGRLGDALLELVELQRASTAVRRGVLGSLLYPALIGAFATAILATIILLIGPIFETMFGEFELTLPTVTAALFWFWHVGYQFVLGFFALLLLGALVYRSLVGRVRWHQRLSSMPVFGPLWYGMAVAEWSGLLAVLLKYQTPLPQALRLAAEGVRNAHVRQLSITLADGAARGRTMSQVMSLARGMPKSLVPLIRWGEKTGTLADALRTGSDMFQNRVRRRAAFLKAVLPPLMFILIFSVIVSVVFALFVPLTSLVSGLS